MRFVRNLKIGMKMRLVMLAQLIPILSLATLYTITTVREFDSVERQDGGIEYVVDARHLIEDIGRHRVAVNRLKGGDPTAATEASAARAGVEKSIAALQALTTADGDRYGMKREIEAFAGLWRDVGSNWQADTTEQSMARHSQAINAAHGLVPIVGERSGLQLEDDPETFHLMEVATERTPRLMVTLLEARGMAVDAAEKEVVPPEQRDAIVIAMGQIRTEVERLHVAVEGVAKYNPDVAADIKEDLSSLETAAKAFTDIGLRAADTVVSKEDVRGFAAAAVGKSYELFDVSEGRLQQRFHDRLLDLRWESGISYAIIALAMLAAILLSFYIERLIARSLNRAVDVFKAIDEGKLDSEIEIECRDETGAVLEALGQTQKRLKDNLDAEHARVDAERVVAAANTRVKQSLDAVSAPVLLADIDYNIIYLNRAMQALFADIRDDLRQVLPHFDPTALVGANMDVFHRNPSHQRQLLDGLTGTHTSNHQVGPLSLRLTHTPVFDEHGRRIGTAMEWINRTQEVAAEKEVASIVEEALGGDLSHRVPTEGKTGFFANLAAGMNTLLDNFGAVVSSIKGSALEVQTGAEEISRGNTSLSQRTEEQASSLEETASSMEEMTSTVKQTADNAMQANQLAMAARTQAEKGGAVVGRAVSAMSGINAASRKIA
ncbi:MAG TPA: HAMP domain-containing protein, partial [Steroidobacteraceae bacterium]|nr:HAMP domain-containing protein [Steroidobacteraceae bacterium]